MTTPYIPRVDFLLRSLQPPDAKRRDAVSLAADYQDGLINSLKLDETFWYQDDSLCEKVPNSSTYGEFNGLRMQALHAALIWCEMVKESDAIGAYSPQTGECRPGCKRHGHELERGY
jgi:hypothetical protein